MTVYTEHPEGLCVLFGPQCSDIEESICHIRDAISKSPTELKFLSEVVDELPSLWTVITGAWPALDRVEGQRQLDALGQLLRGGLTANFVKDGSNLILTPITVMRHIVDFWNLQVIATHPAFPPSLSSRAARPKIIDTQGFCVGILAAIAVASSQNTHEFQIVASNAIRLAICIGALVDLDEIESGNATSMAVRWEALEDYDKVEKILTQCSEVS
jgi:Starter unit:ACP transacylase in aflatoxin biosynthesis